MAWKIDRSGRTKAARRRAELRTRLEAGAKRSELVAEYAEKWAVDPVTVYKHLRKVGGPARNTGNRPVLAERMRLVRQRVQAGAATMEIARELAPVFGISACRISVYVKSVRRAIDRERREADLPPMVWRDDTNAWRSERRRVRAAAMIGWIKQGAGPLDALRRAQGEFGVRVETARAYLRRAWSATREFREERIRRKLAERHRKMAPACAADHPRRPGFQLELEDLPEEVQAEFRRIDEESARLAAGPPSVGDADTPPPGPV